MLFKDLTTEDKKALVEEFNNISKVENKTEAMKLLAESLDIGERTIYYWRDRLLDTVEEPVKKVTATSTLYDSNGEVMLQWVKEDKKDNNKIQAFKEAVDSIVESYVEPAVGRLVHRATDDGLTLYVSNDLHLGGLSWGEETGDRDWDTDKALETFKGAIDTLVDRAPSTEECIVADLGDLMEIDNSDGMTPKSGNILDTDSRYPKVLRVAMEALVYFVDRALDKHDKVYFYNVNGNHDINTGYAITAFVEAWFKDNDRVIIDTSARSCKYHIYGSTLLGFTHGDDIKMTDCGEVMVMHNEDSFSGTRDRYFHFGHNHKDKVLDNRICRAESHRNIAPVNAWAARKGYGRNAGTMKAIVYSKEFGEETRITYNVRQGE